PPPRSTLFPYTTLFRSHHRHGRKQARATLHRHRPEPRVPRARTQDSLGARCADWGRGMRGADTITTSALAAWYGLTRAGVIQRLRKAGLKPVGRGPRGVSLWPRRAALRVMIDTPERGVAK